MILYTKENNNDVLYYQCWFQFPEELYDAMFYEKMALELMHIMILLKIIR